MVSIARACTAENASDASAKTGAFAGLPCEVPSCAAASGANSMIIRSQMPCGGSKPFQSSFSLLTRAKRVLLVVFVESNDVVRANPARRSDRKTLLSAFGKFARGLVVAAREGGLGRGKVGVGEVIFACIGHRQRCVGVGCFRLLNDRRVQK